MIESFLLAISILSILPSRHATCIPPQGCSTALASYTVSPTDTLFDIAMRFATTFPAIQKFSNVTDPDALSIGQMLFIPFTCVCLPSHRLGRTFSYGVTPSDDQLHTIASLRFANLCTPEQIAAANPSQDLSSLSPGVVLSIPVSCFCGNPRVSTSYGLFATYVAQPHDTLASISTSFDVPAGLLQRYNPGAWSNIQAEDSIIFIPAKDESGKYPPFNSENNAGKKGSRKGIIYGALVGGGIILCSLIGITLFYFIPYMEWHPRDYSGDDIPSERVMVDGMPTLEKKRIKGTEFSDLTRSIIYKSVQYSYQQLADATDNFSAEKELGKGGSGSVYYGEIEGQRLAIKKMDLKSKHQFLSELKVLTQVRHANLVQLIGYCAADSLCLAYEFVENGTLMQHLQCAGREGSPLSWATRVMIALDVARGLEYIHEYTSPTYIHRDLKSSNILLDKECHAKVSDFGLTKFDGTPASQSNAIGTFGYMAPEYPMTGVISQKADVYSFGVVLLEIISAKHAVVFDGDGNYRGLVDLFKDVFNGPDEKLKLQTLIDPELGDQYDPESVWKMAKMASACTQANPTLRPDMRTVVVSLMRLAYLNKDDDEIF